MERQSIRTTTPSRQTDGRQKSSKSPILQGITFSVCSPIIDDMTGLNLGLPVAWVVRCKKCSCTINCRAIDPQIEHAQPDKADPPPQDSVIVTCSCCWVAYRYSPTEVFKGPPGPSSNCYRRTPPGPTSNNKDGEKRPNAVLLIAASLIAAVRLNREEIRSSPSVHAKIADSIRLAEMIQARLRG